MTDALARLQPRTPAARAWGTALAVAGPPLVLAAAATVMTPARDGGPTAIVLLVAVAPLLARLVAPPAVLVATTTGVFLAAGALESPWVLVLAVGLASFTVGERASDRVRSAMLVIAVTACASLVAIAMNAEPKEAVGVSFAILVPFWLAGDLVRSRRLETARRVAATEAAVREREQQLLAAADEERRHVARELHDTVAHAVSVMVVQAGAARQVMRTSPADAETSLLAVEATGREAMTELRRMVGALGDADDQPGVAPQPGVDGLAALVARVGAAGLPVRLEVTGDVRPLPAGVDVTVYRVVQEALTNALRHAGGATTLARLAFDPDQLRLEVLDEGAGSPPPSPGTGRGIDGMRQRVALVGGHLEAGPRVGGGFAVRAWIPLAAAAP